MNKKICFVNGANPNFLGGISLYQKNLIKHIQNNKIPYEISWIYKGKENRNYTQDSVNYFEIKTPSIPLHEDILFNQKVKKIIKKNYFDIINSHAIWGYWMKNYSRQKNQKLIHTYHGVTYNFYKNHLGRFGFFKKMLMLPLLIFGKIIEKPPIKKCDKIICVSDKVKNQIEELYGKRDNLVVIRTGVDVKDFKIRKKNEIRKKLNLEQDKIYSLYVGKGGYWTKGLDRTIKLGEEIYKLNNNFRLICIGPDYKKVKSIIENKEFVIFMENVPREKMPLYYSASDIFFCLSRYEGGAPTLVVSEAMASGCLLVCSKDSEQEIISDGKNGLIVEKFNDEDAKSILEILKNKKKKEKIVQNEIITIKKLTLEKWGKEYIKELLK